jgi:hypothetical protein
VKQVQCIEAGGFDDKVPARIAVVAERARVSAWMARAVSASGNRRVTIWET